MSIKSVVLAGAGGNLGPSVLSELRKSFSVTVLSRQSSKSTFPSDVKVVKVGDDYPHAELVEALKGHDALVSTLSGHGFQQQVSLIDAAIEAGVKRIIPSEFGSDTQSEKALAAIPIFQEKAKVLNYIKSKESSGLTWTAIANNCFFDWAFQVTRAGFFQIDLANKKALIFDDGSARWSVSNLHQVGLATRRALEKADETKNKFLYIESFSFSQKQLIDALDKEYGTEFEREYVDGEKWFQEKSEKGKAGDFVAQYSALFAFSVLNGSFEDQPGYANELLDLPKEDLEQSLKEALKGIKA